MSEINEKIVYMVLYRYGEKDYSVVKLMDSVEKAYNYICAQTITTNKIKLVEIDKNYDSSQIDDSCQNMLYIKSGKYLHLDLDDNENILQYIIVPMPIC
jgi:type III secretory pathway component EscV